MANRDWSEDFGRLVQGLTEIGAEIPPHFERIFAKEVRRIGAYSAGDLGSLVMMRCLEERTSHESLSASDVIRILDVVRHRLVRQAANHRERSDSLRIDPADLDPPVLEKIASAEDPLGDVRFLFEGLSAREILVLEGFAEGKTHAIIGDELGISTVAVRQILHRAKEKIVRRFPGGLRA